MNIHEDVKEFIDKALPMVVHGRVVVEVKVSDGQPVSVDGMIYESLKRTKDLKNERNTD